MSKVWIGIGVICCILFLVFIPGPIISTILNDALNIHPFSWTLVIVAVGLFLAGCVMSDQSSDKAWLPWIGSVVVGLFWIFWLFIQGPLMYHDLYIRSTFPDSGLIEQSAIRDIPYTVASTNFGSTNPDSRTAPGDLDYVQGKWIASVNPSGIWNPIMLPTQGFFLYDPDRVDKVVRIVQAMPYAEGGFFFNSATYFVRTKAYFAQFTEILYVQDEKNGEVFAVMSLIKRAGFNRYPYVANIMIVHGDGRYEMLTTAQAEADLRLSEIALKPEWLQAMEVKAYGYRYGALKGLFSRLGRIDIQSSSVNSENKPPYHMETPYGNYWYTPFSPRGSEGLIGIAMSPSHDIDGPTYIWQLPVGQAYGGADFMTSLIEGSPAHRNYTWYRETAESKCGNMIVLEIIPLIRNENGVNRLYFLGYVSMAPKSVEVIFYSIVDPATQTVYQDLQTPAQVNSWLRGEFELQPQVEVETVTTTPAMEICTENLNSKSTDDLITIINNILRELVERTQ